MSNSHDDWHIQNRIYGYFLIIPPNLLLLQKFPFEQIISFFELLRWKRNHPWPLFLWAYWICQIILLALFFRVPPESKHFWLLPLIPAWSELPSSLSYITVSTSSLFSPPLVYQTSLQSPVSTAPRVILKDTVQQCHSSAWLSTCCSVTKLCLTLCDPMHCSMPGFPILHHLQEFAQTHVHWVRDAIQQSHPLSPSSPPSQYQSFPVSESFPMSWFFTSGGQSTGASASASVLPMNIQGWFPLGLTGLISLQSKGLSRVFSSSTIQKHQFFGAQPSFWPNSHTHT